MFGAFNTFGKLGAIGKAIAAAWSPLSLWPDGISSPGMWISPRTLTSEWQDYTGTTPVATPGTVADSANPVGLALDIRAGATVLTDPGNHMLQSTSAARPLASARVNLLTYTEALAGPLWVTGVYGSGTIAVTPNYSLAPDGTTTACRVLATAPGGGDGGVIRYVNLTYDGINVARAVYVKSNTGLAQVITLAAGVGAAIVTVPATGWSRVDVTSATYGYYLNIGLYRPDGTDATCDISIWHPQIQLGTTATDYQAILTDGSTYPSTGFPIAQKYDGVDDGMATAAFAAGTLIDGMDCMIAVRRDAGTIAVAGLNNQAANIFFGIYNQGDAVDPTHQGCGAPVPYVDGVELTGGTSATRGTLYNALTAGDWHILEYRNLNLSAWTQAFWGAFGATFFFNGARGDILLYPSTASTEDKDAARQWLADYYGVTLP